MFDYMLESSPAKRRRENPWAYAVSLALQFVLVGVLILIPLLYTEALPEAMQLTFLTAPPPPPPPPPPVAAAPVKRIKPVSQMEAGRLRAPTAIPKTVTIIKEEEMPDTGMGVVGGIPGGVPGGQMGGVLGGVLGGIAPPPPVPQKPIRVSGGVQQAKLLRRAEPTYPPIARQARIQGTVSLEAIISKSGTVQNLRVLSGHPLLVQSALQAVQQWRYQPTLLSGEPVEVITNIDVIYRLN